MDHVEFRVKAKEMVDYVADYLENIRERRVFPGVKPGFLHDALPTEAPQEGEEWDKIFQDFEDHVMPGITHWQSPHMHAYFPALTSYPSIMGDLLIAGINTLCFTWASSPAGTELETISMNWLGKILGLPETFLNERDHSPGGGVIQTNASEATLCSLLAARTKALTELSKLNPELQTSDLLGHLVAYCSDQAHSSVEKAGLIGLVRMRYIESDNHQSMRGPKLEEAILSDKAKGLVPFWVCATLGTTGTVAFDNLREVGDVCQKYSAWLHVDAAYAGSAFICPEFRHWFDGIEQADTFAFNPSKWLMVNFDCTAMWVKNSAALHKTFNVNPIYLRHENSGRAVDYMHWQIGLSRRFRALKLWFVLRNYGVSGLQKHLRESVRLGAKFEEHVRADNRFEIPQERNLGLVAFRLKGDNALTERLLKGLNARGRMHSVPACFKGIYVIRYVVTSQKTTEQDILDDWHEIQYVASELLTEIFGCLHGNLEPKRVRVNLKDTRNTTFGTSLLLANSPMSPKIVNGTHFAICEYEKVLNACAHTFAQLKLDPKDSPEMRRRIRGLKLSGQKFSLDSCMDMVQSLMPEPAEPSLPQCSEDDTEEASAESSPGDISSTLAYPTTSTFGKNETEIDSSSSQLQVPSSRYRSKSIDVSFSGLGIEETEITVDATKNEIVITPTSLKTIVDEFENVNEDFSKEGIDDFNKENDLSQIESTSKSNPNDTGNNVDDIDDFNTKLTIKGPGSYIRKLIQQFSEAPVENEDLKPEADRQMQTIKDKADALCKKCLNYKGKNTK